MEGRKLRIDLVVEGARERLAIECDGVYARFGEFEKSVEYFDKAISGEPSISRRSPISTAARRGPISG